MSPQQLVHGLITFLHDAFTVLWVGGLGMLALTVVPVLQRRNPAEPEGGTSANRLLAAIGRRHRPWVIASIAGLFATGLLLARSEALDTGFLSFGTPYAALLSAKHIATFLMVAIAVVRMRGMDAKKPGGAVPAPKRQRAGRILIRVNFGIGLLVLLLSALLASM